MEAVNGHATTAAPTAVRLHLQLVGDDAVAVQLVADGAEAMDAEVAPDSEFEGSDASSSSDSSDSDDEAAPGGSEDEPLDVVTNYADIKKIIDDMDADEEGGAAADPAAHGADVELLGAGAPLPSLAALDIKPDDAVQTAGAVQSMLEGMIVIKVIWLPRQQRLAGAHARRTLALQLVPGAVQLMLLIGTCEVLVR